jgi:hypothetical protein
MHLMQGKGEYNNISEVINMNNISIDTDESELKRLIMDAIEKKDVLLAKKYYRILVVKTGDKPRFTDIADLIEALNLFYKKHDDQSQKYYLENLKKLQNEPEKHRDLFDDFTIKYMDKPWFSNFILKYFQSITNPDLNESTSPWVDCAEKFYRDNETEQPLFTKEQIYEAAKTVFLIYDKNPNKAISYPDLKEKYTDRYFNWAKDVLKS